MVALAMHVPSGSKYVGSVANASSRRKAETYLEPRLPTATYSRIVYSRSFPETFSGAYTFQGDALVGLMPRVSVGSMRTAMAGKLGLAALVAALIGFFSVIFVGPNPFGVLLPVAGIIWLVAGKLGADEVKHG